MKVSSFIFLNTYLLSALTNIDARRYFKQSEIVLYRQQPEQIAAAGQQTQITGAPPPERAQVAPAQ
jgi:vacuolar protein sorting-associated protein 26